jgi:hypothetical protein
MTIRDETAETPSETGARSPERPSNLKQYVEAARGEPARLVAASRGQPCRSDVSAVAVEAVMNKVG